MDVWAGLQNASRWSLIRAGASSAEARIDGQRVHFYDIAGQGKGPPVVLLHGLASSATSFYRVMFLLGRRFQRVLVPELPGSGFSPEPSTGPLRLVPQQKLIERFLEQVVGRPAFLVGNSLGGAMALHLALERPELLCALGLIAPAVDHLAPSVKDTLLKRLEVRDGRSARTFLRRVFHRAPWLALLTFPQLVRSFETASTRSNLEELREIDLLNPEKLSRLSVPTLLLWGGSEKLLPPETLEYFRAHLPKSTQVEVVEGFGHVPQLERPNEVVARLERLADELSL